MKFEVLRIGVEIRFTMIYSAGSVLFLRFCRPTETTVCPGIYKYRVQRVFLKSFFENGIANHKKILTLGNKLRVTRGERVGGMQ